MGGWLALLLARELARRAQTDPGLASLVLIAPAVDFTEELMWKRFPPEIKREIEQTGAWARPSQYSDQPYLITRSLIEEGRSHLLLDNMIETGCPVRRAVAARGRAQLPVCPGRCRAHLGQGRRPSPVAARRHRAAHCGGCRVLVHIPHGIRIRPATPAPLAWPRRDDRRLDGARAGRRGTWGNAVSRRARS